LIVEVGSDGAAHPTGIVAEPEPSRAIAPVEQARPPALEAPPPSLSVPVETPKPAKPTRRRRATTRGAVAGELEQPATIAALPAPEAEAKPKPVRTRKRTVKSEAAAAEAETPKPKRRRKTATVSESS
jgi:hypothetical protein